MSLFIPRVPAANRFNRDTFAAAWMRAYGGTNQNAVSAWRVGKKESLRQANRTAQKRGRMALKRQLVADVNEMRQPEEPTTDARDW